MARDTGLEPVTTRLTDRRYYRLSYIPILMRLFFNGIPQVPLNHRLLFLINQSKSNKTQGVYLRLSHRRCCGTFLVCAIIPSIKWSHWHQERDSNPRTPLITESPVFKTGAFNHSAILASNPTYNYYNAYFITCLYLLKVIVSDTKPFLS